MSGGCHRSTLTASGIAPNLDEGRAPMRPIVRDPNLTLASGAREVAKHPGRGSIEEGGEHGWGPASGARSAVLAGLKEDGHERGGTQER
jgi:hypothetical protein